MDATNEAAVAGSQGSRTGVTDCLLAELQASFPVSGGVH